MDRNVIGGETGHSQITLNSLGRGRTFGGTFALFAATNDVNASSAAVPVVQRIEREFLSAPPNESFFPRIMPHLDIVRRVWMV